MIKKFTAVLVLIALISMATLSFAAGSANVTLASDSKLEEGSTVTINFNLTALQAGTGVNSLTADFDYDTDVFEEVTHTSFSSTTGWTPYYSASLKTLTLTNNAKVTSAQTIMTISLKVKAGITKNEATVSLKNIVLSGGSVAAGGVGDIDAGTINITIKKDQEPAVVVKPAEEKQEIKTVTAETKTDASVKKTDIPKTGAEIYGIISAIVFVTFAGVSFVAFKKMKDIK